jgi:hypothetical protein
MCVKHVIFYNVCTVGLGTYLRALAQPTFSCYRVTRAFERRNMSALPLINDPKYAFLKDELDLKEENSGMFDGTWFASGDVSFAAEQGVILKTICMLRCLRKK